MPKSLSTGPSKSVQIKCPQSDKLAIVAVLREGETLSELTRALWRREAMIRAPRARPLSRKRNEGSQYVSKICDVLGLELKVAKKVAVKP